MWPCIALADDPADPAPLRTFTLPKPSGVARAEPAPIQRSGVAPDAAQSLRLSIGAGYVERADWGLSASAAGNAGGWTVDFSTLVTRGATNTSVERGRLLLARANGWFVEAGDVFAPLAGPGVGVRTGWTAGAWRPSLTVMKPKFGDRDDPQVIYRDRLAFRGLQLEGEVDIDRSFLVAGRMDFGRVALEASMRRRDLDRDRSGSATFDLGRGSRLRMGVAASEVGGGSTRMYSAGVHLPITRHFELVIERTMVRDGASLTDTTALVGSLTTARGTLFHRHQWGSFDHTFAGESFALETRHAQSLAAFGVTSSLRFTLQTTAQWTPASRVARWEELQATWQPTSFTTFEVAAPLAAPTDLDRSRLRLVQAITRPWRLELEYGQLAPYQATTRLDDGPRARIFLARTWNVRTPPKPALVEGYVVDEAGRPVTGVRVRWGMTTTETGEAGRFAFRTRGSGDTLELDESSLPADHGWDRASISIASHTKAVRVFRVAPLNTLGGLVFVDGNGNGRYDVGEEARGAVVRLNELQVTATNRDGRFSFYNLPAGTYRVRVRPETGTVSAGPDERLVVLGEGQALTSIDFMLKPAVRPTVWQTVQP